MKEMIKKSKPALLSIAIWLIMILYHGVVLKLISKLLLTISTPFDLNFTLHTLIQLLFIIATSVLSVKKFGYKIEGMVISIPAMYLLFAIYSPPSIYLFVYTGGLQIAFSDLQPPMHPLLASLFITLQYGIIMLITMIIATANLKKAKPTEQIEEKQE